MARKSPEYPVPTHLKRQKPASPPNFFRYKSILSEPRISEYIVRLRNNPKSGLKTFDDLSPSIKASSRYTSTHLELARKSFKEAERIHANQKRKGTGEPYIVHPLSVAYLAVLLEYPMEVVCAALLHDAIEDSTHGNLLTKSNIEMLYRDIHQASPGFGVRVAHLVDLVTKPKIDRNQHWVFADDVRYDRINDQYVKTLSDTRDRVYFERLLNSGDIQALLIKVLDMAHHFTTLKGVSTVQFEKTFRVAVQHLLKPASILLPPKDFEMLKETIDLWGFRLPFTLREPHLPEDVLTHFTRRSGLGYNSIFDHPAPEIATISVYGNHIDAFVNGYVEIGFPARMQLNYESSLFPFLSPEFKALPHFRISRSKSLVASTAPAFEEIRRLYGFNPEPHLNQRQLSLKFPREPAQMLEQIFSLGDCDQNSRMKYSKYKPGYVDVFDEDGRFFFDIPLASLSEADPTFTNGLGAMIDETRRRFDALLVSLRDFYGNVLPQHLEPYEEPTKP